MGLIAPDSSCLEGSPPPKHNVFKQPSGRPRSQNARSISFAEDFIYDSERLPSYAREDGQTRSVGIGFNKPPSSAAESAAAIRRKKLSNSSSMMSDSDYLNFSDTEGKSDGSNLPPPAKGTRSNKPFPLPSAASRSGNGTFSEQASDANGTNGLSYTMPKSPASVAMQKLTSKLAAVSSSRASGGRDMERDDNEDDESEVPLECLCFFKHLGEGAKK